MTCLAHRSLRTALAMGLAVLTSACSLLDYTPPRPDSTGVVRIGCQKSAQSSADEMAFCDQRATEACDGPALLLDSSFGAPPVDAKTGFHQQGAFVSGVARYQCTPR
jgi:hypothetical protein